MAEKDKGKEKEEDDDEIGTDSELRKYGEGKKSRDDDKAKDKGNR